MTNKGNMGIRVTGNYVTVSGNTVYNSVEDGISVVGDYAYVFENTVINSGHYVADDGETVIGRDEAGIRILGGSSIISNNVVIQTNGTGISVVGPYTTVSDNDVNRNSEGIVILGEYARVIGNFVGDNDGIGIKVTGENAVIFNNTVTGNNYTGIWVESDYAVINQNTVINNGASFTCNHPDFNLEQMVIEHVGQEYYVMLNDIENYVNNVLDALDLREWLLNQENALIVSLMNPDLSLEERESLTNQLTEVQLRLSSLVIPGIGEISDHLVYKIAVWTGVYGNAAQSIYHDSVGVTLNGLRNYDDEGVGIWAHGDDMTIYDNTIADNTYFGLSVFGNGLNVTYNDVSGNGGGISLKGDGSTLEWNTAEHNGWIGIYVDGVNNYIHLNTVSFNEASGMFVYGSNKVMGNIIESNSFDGLYVLGVNLVTSNVLNDNGGNGIVSTLGAEGEGSHTGGVNVISGNFGSGNKLFGILSPLQLEVANGVEGELGGSVGVSILSLIPRLPDIIDYGLSLADVLASGINPILSGIF